MGSSTSGDQQGKPFGAQVPEGFFGMSRDEQLEWARGLVDSLRFGREAAQDGEDAAEDAPEATSGERPGLPPTDAPEDA